MRKRKLVAVLAGLAVVAVAGVVVLWRPPQGDRITFENFARIEEGMSQEEVEAILGPPGDYRTGPVRSDVSPKGVDWGLFNPFLKSRARWNGDTAEITVQFHRRKGAVFACCDGVSRAEQSALDNLLWRAKRQWHRWFP
jgi:hypothetical protein